MRLVLVGTILSLVVSFASAAAGQLQPVPGNDPKGEDAIPFELFASFERIEQGNPVLALRPPLWVADVVYRPLADCTVTAELAGAFRRDERSPTIVNFVETIRSSSRV